MRKIFRKILGESKEISRLNESLAKTKTALHEAKATLATAKESLSQAKPFIKGPLARLLAESASTNLTPEQRSQLIGWEHRITFSQNGEDIAASFHLSGEAEKGVMVDIGAYHPYRFSNTFFFHLQGWPCVSVDASAESVAIFNQVRPADTNLCCLVSDKEETLEFYQFAEGAWNTTNAEVVSMLESRGLDQTKLVAKTQQTTVPIMHLLEQHVGDKKFDLLDIDVEGMDAKLLLGIDLKRFRPKVILAEIGDSIMSTEPMKSHLADAGYKVRGHCGHTSVIVRLQAD
jgi:FkbM family methyltransferase